MINSAVKFVANAGAAVSIVAALASCSSSSSSDRTLHLWAMGREGEVVFQLIPEFEKAHPGLKIEVQQIPWSAAHEKLLTAYVGDATPDIAMLGNTWVPEFSAVDALEPLDSRVASSAAAPKSGFFEGVWNTNVVDGVTYGIPWYVDTRVIFYRSDLLAQAGYSSMPTTWAEWRASMVKIKAKMTARQYPLLIPTTEWPPPVILGLQAGSPLLKDNGQFGAFHDPAFMKA
ncbi:MAG: extracellular solute-binding protein, partial [Gemmatimonadales bacterium]